MDPHYISKLTTSSVKPPVVAGTRRWQTLHDKNENNKEVSMMQEYYRDDLMAGDQPGIPNMKTKDIRMDADMVGDHHPLSETFYRKLQDLKKEHQKTLTLLNQYYISGRERPHSSRSNSGRKVINHLVPDYLDDVENNTLLHGTKFNDEPDLVPGFTKQECLVRLKHQERMDLEEVASSSVVDSAKVNDDVSSNVDSAEVINKMWDHFSLKDYANRGNRRLVRKEIKLRPKSAPTKKKGWSPIITIPQPFNMTLREEQKEAKSHTRSSMEVFQRQKEREEVESLELMKQPKARDPPAHIYLPLYEEMKERREQRSRFNKENSIATLMAIQQPFSFAERDEHKLKLKKQTMMEKEGREFVKMQKSSHFEARPVPYSVHDPTISDKMIEEELYRKIKKKLRSEDLMKESSLPPRMRAHELMADNRRREWQDKVERQSSHTFRPETHEVPNFSAIHHRENMEALGRKVESDTTIVEPFNLRTTERSRKRQQTREKELKELQESWEEDNRRIRPCKLSSSTDTIPARMTDSSRLRIDNMRRSLQEADQVVKRAEDGDRERKERRKNLAQRIARRATSNDGSISLAATQYEKLRQYRKELRERQSRYSKFLEEVRHRVDGRPLLFEQHDEKIAKARAEKRYQDILESSGLSDQAIDSSRSLESDNFEPLTSHDLRSSNDDNASQVDDESEIKTNSRLSSLRTVDVQDDVNDDDASSMSDVTLDDEGGVKEETRKEWTESREKHVEFA